MPSKLINKHARDYIEGFLPSQIRASMHAWFIQKLIVGQLAAGPSITTEDMENYLAINKWERAVIDASQAGKELPEPPEFFASYIQEF